MSISGYKGSSLSKKKCRDELPNTAARFQPLNLNVLHLYRITPPRRNMVGTGGLITEILTVTDIPWHQTTLATKRRQLPREAPN